MLTISGVHAFYGQIEALKGIDLEVAKGEIVTLIGANGAGKSTLLMTICGSPRARNGSIAFEGRDITRMATYEIMRMGIAQSPEGRRIFPRMTVMENLQMGALTADPTKFDEDVERVFSLFPILKQRQGQRGGTLSGGEQQMLAIGRALMSRPRLLLLDESSPAGGRKGYLEVAGRAAGVPPQGGVLQSLVWLRNAGMVEFEDAWLQRLQSRGRQMKSGFLRALRGIGMVEVSDEMLAEIGDARPDYDVDQLDLARMLAMARDMYQAGRAQVGD